MSPTTTPNGYYELAVRHSLGLSYVLVGQHGPTFDLKDLDTIVYEEGRPQAKWDEIKGKLDTAHAAALERRSVENPISGFYDALLAEVSPASGLALGYYRNFVEPLVRQVRTAAGSVEIDGDEVPDREQNRAGLEVWIPSVLAGAYPDAISDLLLQTDPPRLLEARVAGPHRSFSMYALPDRDDGVVLVDVPTTLNVLVGAIRGRYSALQVDQGSDEWASLEAQEIGRFSESLKRRLREVDAKAIRSRVDIVAWEVPGE